MSEMKIEPQINFLDFLKRRSASWYLAWFFLFVAVPAILFGMQLFVINGINSGIILPDSTIFIYYANTTHPTASSLFLTNFVHKFWAPSHLIDNISVYWLFLILIFFSEIILFECDQTRKEHDFFISLFLIFLVFPFSISGVSLIVFRAIGGTGFNGFSGIVAAFIGYFWFSLYTFYFLVRKKIFKTLNKVKKMDYFMVGCFFFPILSFILMNFMAYDNLAGHITGYILGFLSALGIYLVRKKNYDGVLMSLLFVILIYTTSFGWMLI